MKSLFILAVSIIGAACGICYAADKYDASQISCRTYYDQSVNGLYLVKAETCNGRLGGQRSYRTISRKPLFEEF